MYHGEALVEVPGSFLDALLHTRAHGTFTIRTSPSARLQRPIPEAALLCSDPDSTGSLVTIGVLWESCHCRCAVGVLSL